MVLTFTHRPDLLRLPEIIGALTLLALIVGVRRNRISRKEPQLIFATSFALVPFLVFNQQVITGRSIQPYHYEDLIANYVVLLGLVVTVKLLRPSITRRTALLITFACLLLGTIDVSLDLHLRYSANARSDEMVPVLMRLKEQATHDGTWEGLHSHGKAPALVFSPEFGISTVLPTWAPQGSLLAPASVAFQSLSEAERKERLYQHLYYCGKDMEFLRELLNDRIDDTFLTHFVKRLIFGPEREVPRLSPDFQPIREDEIETEVRNYGVCVRSFSRDQALKFPLGYAVIPSDREFDYSYIDRWYERDSGEHFGAYTLYRLKLRR
ncbi:MAG TPA: hypothetical protein VMZ30_13140 [Pyrinomonadaceae bacterium]|nr:hypothetical protein [Pyrinomonadaceae bacterium]